MEHKLILGGEQFLPFARSRIKALKATGLKYASQKFEIDGVSIRVRIAGEHEYIELSGGVSNYAVSAKGNDSEDHFTIELVEKDGSVGAKKKTSPGDIYHQTDWVGASGAVITYDNGCPARYRWDYPSSATPAKAVMTYAGANINTGDKKVLGAGLIVSGGPEKRKYLIFATDGAPVNSTAGGQHSTDFYFIRVAAKNTAQEAPVLFGGYAPYSYDPEFGRIDFTEEPTIASYPSIVKGTKPDPWFFDAAGRRAVSAVIEPNFRLLRRGFVANINFTASDDGVSMVYAGKTDETYRKEFSQATRIIEDSVVESEIVDVASTYELKDESGPPGTPTRYVTRIEHKTTVVGNGSRKSRFREATNDLLLGADFLASGERVAVVATVSHAGVQELVLTGAGEVSNLGEQPYAPTIVSVEHTYKTSHSTTSTTRYKERRVELFFGGEKIVDVVNKIPDGPAVGIPDVTDYIESGLVGQELIYGVRGLFVTKLSSRSNDIETSLAIFSRLDARYGSALYFRVNSKTTGHNQVMSRNGTAVTGEVTVGVKEFSISLVAVGLSPKEQTCFVSDQTYTPFSDFSPSLSTSGDNDASVSILTSTPEAVWANSPVRYLMVHWTLGKGALNPVLAHANKNQWVYSVPTDTLSSHFSGGLSLAGFVAGMGRPSAMSIKKTSSVVESNNLKGALSADASKYVGYVKLAKAATPYPSGGA